AVVPAGDFRAHQTRRRRPRPHRRSACPRRLGCRSGGGTGLGGAQGGSRGADRGHALISFLISYMAPIMFAALVIFLLLGYPAAFSLGAVGLIFALLGIKLGLFQPDFLQALPERVYGVMANDTLLAIPFFTFMGLILE